MKFEHIYNDRPFNYGYASDPEGTLCAIMYSFKLYSIYYVEYNIIEYPRELRLEKKEKGSKMNYGMGWVFVKALVIGKLSS